jgi:hypothetical protein
MSVSALRPAVLRPDLVQVFRRSDGAFACKPDRMPLQAEEMLIGRGLTPADAQELMEEFNAAALGLTRRGPGDRR